MPGKCVYNSIWEGNSEFEGWVKPCIGDPSKAYCRVCNRSFDISNMGVAALKSHAKSLKHISTLKRDNQTSQRSVPITFFMKNKTETLFPVPSHSNVESNQNITPASEQNATTSGNIQNYLLQQNTLKAEILWALETVMSHQSYNSNRNKPQLFQAMFPDSQIAAQFSMRATKCSYLITHGIAPYIKKKLINEIKKAEFYVASFDEVMNATMQTKQMDIVIRFWSESEGMVCTRYLGSQFMGHGRAVDLCESFVKGLSTLGMKNLLQVSMDGPNVNWSFYDKVCELRKDEHMNGLIEIGSCSLHVVHGALQSGLYAAGWNLPEFLRGIHTLFRDSPARRADFSELTGCTDFPLPFCTTRWVEDVRVVERALVLLPHIAVYVNQLLKKPPSQIPKTSTFITVKEGCLDKLLVCKLKFFRFIAQQFQPYLTKFQSPAPMVPFLASELEDLLVNLMERFVKHEEVKACNTCLKLAKFDPKKKEKRVPLKKVDLGFETKKALSDDVKEGKITELQAVQFRSECCEFFVAALSKLLDRCPLRYPMTRYATSLDPARMVTREDCIDTFSKLLSILQHAGLRTPTECDAILLQYKQFLGDLKRDNMLECKAYKSCNSRLDHFLLKHLEEEKEELKKVFILVLSLSHGQSDIERGFSVNSAMEVENLKEHNLVAMKTVYNEVQNTSGTVVDYPLTKDLLTSCKHARQRYEQYLDDEKKKAVENRQQRKRKLLLEELKDVKARKLCLAKTIESLNKEADELAKQAEKKKQFFILSKSNALRQKAVDHSKEIQTMEKQEEKIENDLKKI